MSQYATNPQTLEEALEPEKVQVKNWSAFIESEVVNFFNTYNYHNSNMRSSQGLIITKFRKFFFHSDGKIQNHFHLSYHNKGIAYRILFFPH